MFPLSDVITAATASTVDSKKNMQRCDENKIGEDRDKGTKHQHTAEYRLCERDYDNGIMLIFDELGPYGRN